MDCVPGWCRGSYGVGRVPKGYGPVWIVYLGCGRSFLGCGGGS